MVDRIEQQHRHRHAATPTGHWRDRRGDWLPPPQSARQPQSRRGPPGGRWVGAGVDADIHYRGPRL